jgi:hypothetical protein
MVFGTEVKVTLSGEVWKVTVAARVPVVENVILHTAQGLLPLKFDTPVCVAFPVAAKVKEQSLDCAEAGRGFNGVCW